MFSSENKKLKLWTFGIYHIFAIEPMLLFVDVYFRNEIPDLFDDYIFGGLEMRIIVIVKTQWT